MEILNIISEDIEQTKNLGKNLAFLIKKDHKRFSQIILLTGDLGAGKTIFVKGIADGLNINKNITSPTFNLINEYEGNPGLIHMDFYRLNHKKELIDIGIEEYLNLNMVKAVEWPQLIFNYINDEFIFIKIINIAKNKREIIINAEGKISKKIIRGLKENANIRN